MDNFKINYNHIEKISVLFMSIFLNGYILEHIFINRSVSISGLSYFLLLITLVLDIFLRKKHIELKIEDFLIFVFLFFILVSFFNSPIPKKAIIKVFRILSLVILPYYITRITINKSKNINFLINIFYYISIFVSGIILYLFIFKYHFKFMRYDFLGANQIPVSTLLGIGFVITLIKINKNIVVNSIVIIINLFSILLIGTRSMFLGIFIVLIFYLCLNINKINKKNIVILFSIIIIMFSVFYFNSYLYDYIPNYNRLLSIFDFNQDASIKIRFNHYFNSWNLIRKKPFFGVGVGGYNYYFNGYPHNINLEIASENGLITLVVFYIVLSITLGRILFNKIKVDDNFKIIFLVFIMILLQTQFSYDLTMHKNLFVFYALLINITSLNII